MSITDYRTDFSKAKNLGSAKSGSHHWLMQRLTAIVLAFSVLWVFYLGVKFADLSMGEIVIELQKPCNVIALMAFSVAGFYHGALGMQVVIEDYVSCICARNTMIILVKLFSFVTIIACLASLIYLMVL